jgi:hypothetical protein
VQAGRPKAGASASANIGKNQKQNSNVSASGGSKNKTVQGLMRFLPEYQALPSFKIAVPKE